MFERFGPLKRCGIHWNDLGLSKGTADIEYMYPQDARTAKQEYNGKNMSGRNLSVEWSRNGLQGENRRRVVIRKKLGGVNRNQQQRRNGESNGNVRNSRDNVRRGMQRKSFNRGGLNKYNKF
jgi:RNA recognition motif-containing protein